MNVSKTIYAMAMAGACSATAFIHPVQGAEWLSNFPAPLPSTVTAPTSYYTDANYKMAILFNSTATFQITDITLAFANTSTGTVTNFSIEIYNSDGVEPTTLFSGASSDLNLTLTEGAIPSAHVKTFTASDLTNIAALTLPAGNYAIVLSSGSLSAPGLAYDYTLLTPSASGGSPLSYTGFSQHYSTPTPAWYPTTDIPYMAIGTISSPSAVPEARGSVAGLGLAMAGLYQLRRRRRAERSKSAVSA